MKNPTPRYATHAGRFNVGDVIKSYDFKGETDCYFLGRVTNDHCVRDGVHYYECETIERVWGGKTDPQAKTKTPAFFAPHQVCFFEYDERLEPVTSVYPVLPMPSRDDGCRPVLWGCVLCLHYETDDYEAGEYPTEGIAVGAVEGDYVLNQVEGFFVGDLRAYTLRPEGNLNSIATGYFSAQIPEALAHQALRSIYAVLGI